MQHKNLWKNIDLLLHDEVKFVILDRADYDYAKEICEKYDLFNKRQQILLSPVHNNSILRKWSTGSLTAFLLD